MIDSYTTLLQAAELYHSLGLQPIPLYGLRSDLSCQCGRPDCRAPGKHPIGSGWQKRAVRDLDTLREVFRDHQGNIGIALLNQLVLIDVDGATGLQTLDTLPKLPHTFAQQSGSGIGGHYVFRLAPGQSAERITDRRFAAGIDVKIRGQFVAAPSKHKSGQHYEIVNWAEPALLPDSLYQLIVKPEAPKRTQSTQSNQELYERTRAYVNKMDPAVSGSGGHAQAYKVACKIVAQGLTEEEEEELFEEYSDRCDPPWSASERSHKLADARRNSTSEQLPERRLRLVDTQSQEPPADTGWKGDLKYGSDRHGDPVLMRIPGNVVLILQNDERWKDKLRKDVFAADFRLTDPPWSDHYRAADPSPYWRDSDTSRLQTWLIDNYRLDLPVTTIEQAVTMVAEAAEYNSAKEWFEGLQWDGVARVDSWLSRYLGVDQSAYVSRVGRWWLISAVARVYSPGCKVDHVLILHGDQGKGKSSAAGILAGPDWFSDTALTIGDKDAYLAMNGKLIVEMAELEALNRAESNAIKGFLSSRSDRYRPPYARRVIDVPRRCVFVGTTNHDEILRDDTGDRRFWPVTCGEIDREGLQRDREQLWAEVVTLYKADQPWWPATAGERKICEDVQSQYKTVDPWQAVIAAELSISSTQRTTVEHVLANILVVHKAQWDQRCKARVAKCLTQLGWSARNDVHFDGSRRRYYVKVDNIDSGH